MVPDDQSQHGQFQRPPQTFTDRADREITIRRFDDDIDSLMSMYERFETADRSQGLPPVREDAIQRWLEVLAEGISVVAWDSERAVGHATLLSCGDGTHELTIFVDSEYQLAGIGSQLIRCLLGAGQKAGVEAVWLSVERSNHVAMNLYRSVGFETTSSAGLEHEMELSL